MKNPFFPTKRRRLGELLVAQGRVTPDDMTRMLRLQKQVGKPLGQILIQEQLLTEEELIPALAEQMGIPHVWLRKGLVDPSVVHVLPKELALRYKVVPMFCVNGILTLATADPDALFVFDEITKITGKDVQPVVCRDEDILAAIETAYTRDVDIEEVMTTLDEANLEIVKTRDDRAVSELASLAEGSPVINLTHSILLKAVRDGASDIHLEPMKDRFQVRIRIDGILYEMMAPKIDMHPAVVSRLKVMANLDIAERRMPQDGRIQVNADGHAVDLRFSSMPGIHGEKVVIRILDQRKVILDINRLGFEAGTLKRFKSLLRQPHGLIQVCGPTGSGKTTTLYAAITMLNSPEKNIVTIEDPVEYQLNGVNQNQVNEGIGLSFAKFLKHALRQDPDILLVGEIRDRETAEIAIQASLTGHLVLSTMHTNDSPSAIARMLDMRVEPYMIASALLAAMAQRLVRCICPECKTGYYPSKSVLLELGLDENDKRRLVHGKGCGGCYDSGYRGRASLHEILAMDDDLQALILESPSSDALRQYLGKSGFRPLARDGREKVLAGLTTIEEIRRISMDG
ncbi:MAG: Flp pilus assembly complex ATPase component TadA [Desulfobacterales bacterium]|nr:Flp pilus assembly complex ATPase component TadA [Desulfobacterales bacterium]